MALEFPYDPTVVANNIDFYIAEHHNRQGSQIAELTNRVNRFWADDAGRPTPTVDPDFSDPYPTGFNISRGKLEGWDGSAWVQTSIHAAQHEDDGADEISIAGLAGESVTPQPPKTHVSSHISGGSDPLTSAQLIEAVVKRLRESGGPTNLLLGAIADGEFLKRSGPTIIGGAAGGVGVSAGETVIQSADLTLTTSPQVVPGLTKTFTPPSACRAFVIGSVAYRDEPTVDNFFARMALYLDGGEVDLISNTIRGSGGFHVHDLGIHAVMPLTAAEHIIDIRGFKSGGSTGKIFKSGTFGGILSIVLIEDSAL